MHTQRILFKRGEVHLGSSNQVWFRWFPAPPFGYPFHSVPFTHCLFLFLFTSFCLHVLAPHPFFLLRLCPCCAHICTLVCHLVTWPPLSGGVCETLGVTGVPSNVLFPFSAGALSTPWQTQCNEAMFFWSGKHGLITRVYLQLYPRISYLAPLQLEQDDQPLHPFHHCSHVSTLEFGIPELACGIQFRTHFLSVCLARTLAPPTSSCSSSF